MSVAIILALVSCSAGGGDNRQNESLPQTAPSAQPPTMRPLTFAPAVEPITVVAAAFSIASSLKTLFGGGNNSGEIKRRLDQIIAQNNLILQTLGQIVGILNNLGVTVRESVRYEMIFDKQALLAGEARQLYEVWSAELLDPRARELAARRYQNDILPDVRDVTRQLMEEGYGYTPADTIGHAMLMEFWMSARLGERRSYRREIATTYVGYFDRALSPTTPLSPGKALADAIALRDNMRTILDAADAQLGSGGWTAEVHRGTRSRQSGRTTHYTDYRILQTATGNQRDGYAVSSREQVLREYSETEPGECRRCLVFAASPARRGDNTPAGRVAFWNQSRQTMLNAVRDIEILTRINQTLSLYREQAESVRVNG